MAQKYKGIELEIGGNTSGLKKALNDVDKQLNTTQLELGKVDRLLKLDPKNTELLAQKQKLLSGQVENTKERLEALKSTKAKADEAMKNGTEVNEKQYRELQREIVQTEQNLKNLAKQAAQNGLDKVSKGAANLAKGAAITATAVVGIGTAAYATANKIADAGDEIDKHSQKLGISAEAYQRWEQVCQHSGTSIDSLKKGMQTLETKIASNDEGFKKLGISIEGASKEDVFKQTILSLQKIEDPIKRNQTAIELFGSKATMEMGALLNCTEEETQAMLDNANVMSNENVKAAAQFKDMQQDLNNTISTLGSEILANLMPFITDLMDKLKEFISSHKEQIQGFCDRIKEFGQWCIDNMGLIEALITAIGTAFITWNVASMIQGVVGAIKAFKAANEGATTAQALLNAVMGANPIGLIVAAIAGLVAAFIVLWNKCDWFRNFWIGLWDNIKNVFSTVVDFIKENWKQLATFIVNPIAGVIALLYKLNPKFKAWVDNLINSIIAWFGRMKDVGVNLIKGLWNGIGDTVEWLKEKVKGVVDKIKGWFTGKDGFDEHSPSKWAEKVGVFLMQGLAEGITNDMSAEQALEKKISNLKNFMSKELGITDTDIKLSDAEYELWSLQNPNADENTKNNKKIGLLMSKITAQSEAVQIANDALYESVQLTGENSDESREYQLQLVNERIELEKLTAEMEKVLSVRQQMYEQKTVDYNSSLKALNRNPIAYMRQNNTVYGTAQGQTVNNNVTQNYYGYKGTISENNAALRKTLKNAEVSLA